MKKTLMGLLLLCAAFVSCRSQFETLLSSGDAESKYAAAFEYFNAGKYQRAAQLFESLAIVTEGTERDDTVQYYWALSNYSNHDFYAAETNFSRYLQNFPASQFTESASYMRIECLYKQTLRYELDQTPTYRAITSINEYMMEHPGGANIEACEHMLKDLNQRLDRKAFESARLYYTMEDYKAARVALKNVLKDDSENIYREDILYYIAMSSYKYASMSVESKQKERYMIFYDDYLNFIGEYPESRYRKEIDNYFEKSGLHQSSK